MFYQEAGLLPLDCVWLQQGLTFYNACRQAEPGSLIHQVFVDNFRAAITRCTQNWAFGLKPHFHKIGYSITFQDGLLPYLSSPEVQHRLASHLLTPVSTLSVSPRACPSQNAMLCTYFSWFARPQEIAKKALPMKSFLPRRFLQHLLRFRTGCHNLPIVRGRLSSVSRHSEVCPLCQSDSLGDEMHAVFECSALAHIRLNHHILSFRPHQTMKAFMWQESLGAVASFIRDMLEFYEDHTTI